MIELDLDQVIQQVKSQMDQVLNQKIIQLENNQQKQEEKIIQYQKVQQDHQEKIIQLESKVFKLEEQIKQMRESEQSEPISESGPLVHPTAVYKTRLEDVEQVPLNLVKAEIPSHYNMIRYFLIRDFQSQEEIRKIISAFRQLVNQENSLWLAFAFQFYQFMIFKSQNYQEMKQIMTKVLQQNTEQVLIDFFFNKFEQLRGQTGFDQINGYNALFFNSNNNDGKFCKLVIKLTQNLVKTPLSQFGQQPTNDQVMQCLAQFFQVYIKAVEIDQNSFFKRVFVAGDENNFQITLYYKGNEFHIAYAAVLTE